MRASEAKRLIGDGGDPSERREWQELGVPEANPPTVMEWRSPQQKRFERAKQSEREGMDPSERSEANDTGYGIVDARLWIRDQG
jgi:hypothetical protein